VNGRYLTPRASYSMNNQHLAISRACPHFYLLQSGKALHALRPDKCTYCLVAAGFPMSSALKRFHYWTYILPNRTQYDLQSAYSTNTTYSISSRSQLVQRITRVEPFPSPSKTRRNVHTFQQETSPSSNSHAPYLTSPTRAAVQLREKNLKAYRRAQCPTQQPASATRLMLPYVLQRTSSLLIASQKEADFPLPYPRWSQCSLSLFSISMSRSVCPHPRLSC